MGHCTMAAIHAPAAASCPAACKLQEGLSADGIRSFCLARAGRVDSIASRTHGTAAVRARCSCPAARCEGRWSMSSAGQRYFWKGFSQKGQQIGNLETLARCLQAESTLSAEKDSVASQNGVAGRAGDREGLQEDGASSENEGEETYGEVNKILGSRVVDRKTQYLIEWKDDHPDSWEPAENIARDVLSEYESVWWQAARKAEDQKLVELLQDDRRDVDAIDENERTALLFAAGMGSERCVRQLVEAGADIHWQDKDGYSALHIASGYVHTSVVRALLELGADPELEDAKGRSSLKLAQDLLNGMPKTNPMLFAKRLALDQVVKLLDEAIFETVEVEQILDKRIGERAVTEYLVKWSDGSEDSWIPASDVGEDLVSDYEKGLEYGIAEMALDKREVNGKVEYLVKWADSEENTWEPEGNIADEVVAEYEKSHSKS